MSIEYWTTANTAGSGAAWSTGNTELFMDRADHLRTTYGHPQTVTGSVGPTSPVINTDDLFGHFTHTETYGTPSPEPTATTLADILKMVDGYKSPIYDKEEIKRLEDKAVNKKVHNILKKLLT